MERVVFSIDNCGDLHTLSRFLRWVDTHRAMSRLDGGFRVACGEWEGKAELSFNMSREDIEIVVLNSGYVNGQECFLLVSSHKNTLHLWHPSKPDVWQRVEDDGSTRYVS